MECKHECSVIYTKCNTKIIDTNFQCRHCAKIFSWNDWQDILTYRCEQCNGTGKIEIGFNEYLTCTACKVVE